MKMLDKINSIFQEGAIALKNHDQAFWYTPQEEGYTHSVLAKRTMSTYDFPYIDKKEKERVVTLVSLAESISSYRDLCVTDLHNLTVPSSAIPLEISVEDMEECPLKSILTTLSAEDRKFYSYGDYVMDDTEEMVIYKGLLPEPVPSFESSEYKDLIKNFDQSRKIGRRNSLAKKLVSLIGLKYDSYDTKEALADLCWEAKNRRDTNSHYTEEDLIGRFDSYFASWRPKKKSEKPIPEVEPTEVERTTLEQQGFDEAVRDTPINMDAIDMIAETEPERPGTNAATEIDGGTDVAMPW